MRFLCASNLHLGRRVAGLPEYAGLDVSRMSAAAVLNRLANAAISYEVDAVLLAGDVIDREAGQFEPVGALQQALGLLAREGIPVVAIAGDEDFDALPRAIHMLGESLPEESVTLLDGSTSSVEVGRNGERARVIGLSQSDGMGIGDVLATLPVVDESQPSVVMLHASLTDGNAPKGTFQPLRLGDLASSGIDIWVLGAQREPDIVVLDSTTVVETGATMPTEAGETGMHGATLVELFDGGQVVCDLVPLSPVQFEDIDLDISGIEALEDVEGAIVQALHATLDDVTAADALASLSAVLCTVHLAGTTALHAELPAFVSDLVRSLAVQHQGVTGAIVGMEVDTQPRIDLDPLLGRPDPVGELARLLRSLDDDERTPAPLLAQEALIQRAIDRLLGVHRSRIFAGVAHDAEPEVEAARRQLRREAWNVLDALVRQRGVD